MQVDVTGIAKKAFRLNERSPGGPAWILAEHNSAFKLRLSPLAVIMMAIRVTSTMVWSGKVKDLGAGAVLNRRDYSVDFALQLGERDKDMGDIDFTKPVMTIPLGTGTFSEYWRDWWLIVVREYFGWFALLPAFGALKWMSHNWPPSLEFLDPPRLYRADHLLFTADKNLSDYYDGPLEPGQNNLEVVKSEVEMSDLFFDFAASSFNTTRIEVLAPNVVYTSQPGFITQPQYQFDGSGNIVFRAASDLLGNHNGEVLGICKIPSSLNIVSIA